MFLSISARGKGIICGIIAAVTYGMIPMFTIPLYDAGLNVNSTLIYRYLFAIAGLAILMKVRSVPFDVTLKELGSCAILGTCMAASSYFLFWSYELLDVGIASTVLFTYPVFVAIIMSVFFRERITFLTILSIAGAVGGVALLSGGEGHVSWCGIFVVICSAVSYGAYIVLIKVLPVKRLTMETMIFYISLFILLYFVAFQLMQHGTIPLMPMDPVSVICILALALVSTTLSLYAIGVAVRLAGATPAAIMGALEPVTGVLVGVLAQGEKMTWNLFAGLVAILAAVMLIICEKAILDFLSRRKTA